MTEEKREVYQAPTVLKSVELTTQTMICVSPTVTIALTDPFARNAAEVEW